MKKISIFALVLFPLLSFAQPKKRCGTYEYWQSMKHQDPTLPVKEERLNREARDWMSQHATRGTGAIITIPVVVHVLYNTEEENLPDEVIQSQIDVLNQDFARQNQDALNTPAVWQSLAAGTSIQFCLASITPDSVPTNGIERKFTPNESWSDFNAMKFSSSGGLDGWNRNYYMNIWVGNLTGSSIGITQMPYGGPASTDGMCVTYKTFGRIGDHLDPEYNLGRTVTHETGHWLGLYHIWGDDPGCEGTGSDLIDDTPDQGDNTFGCPAFPRLDGCSPDFPGIMFMNYMDYSDDACMNMFTREQALKMESVLNTIRTTIQNNSASCNGVIVVSLPVKIFPNPVTDDILIHTYFNVPASIEFSIKDIFGRELFHRLETLSSYEKVRFDATSIPSGVYVVSATSGNYSITEKVIVAHR